jgi:hypothetical protein
MSYNYNPSSQKAEEFINHEEILETLSYAEKNKNNVELIDQILAKARLLKWAVFEDGPDLEWLMNVILVERHNEAHNAVLEYKDLIHSVLRKEGVLAN